MNPAILPSNSVDKNYLLRLLNGNSEMMVVVLSEIAQNITNCLSEINSSLKAQDAIGVAAYASRAKSAFDILREDELVKAFNSIEQDARNGKISLAECTFYSAYKPAILCLVALWEAV